MAQLREMAFPAAVKYINMGAKIASMPFAGKMMGENQADKIKNLYAPVFKSLIKYHDEGEDRFIFNAPAAIMVYGEKQDESLAISCPIALFNCILMAHTLGIGSLLNSFLLTAVNHNKKVKNWIGIPKTDKCFGAIILGYQAVKYNSFVIRKPANVRWV
jgi:hypothetical protein